MPLYEYYCPPCGSQFEVLRPMSQMDHPAVCPSGHTTNNRILSLFSFAHAAAESRAPVAGMDACCMDNSLPPGMGGCSCC